jgi:chemotaxis protein MotB
MTPASPVRLPRYLRQAADNRDRWMISYADVVTILLILFIAIAAQAYQHRAPTAVRSPVPTPVPTRATPAVTPMLPVQLAPAPQSANPALSRARETLEKNGLELRMEQRGLVITLRQGILFSSGDDSVRSQALPAIEHIADVLRGMGNKVLLVGHADTVPIHNRNFRNNWELSSARSLNLLKLLTGQFGLAEERFSIASDGSQSPQEPNDSEDGRARNRRVEIVILDDPSVLVR